MDLTTQSIGLLAGLLTTLAFLPQVWQTYRSKQVRDLSLSWAATFTLGILLWLAYGLLLGELPVILANVFSLILVASLLAMKLLYRNLPHNQGA
ncbi:MAG: SemiSWEET transporter [bacterium]|nr:SemiSWEET transporter [bacterium]